MQTKFNQVLEDLREEPFQILFEERGRPGFYNGKIGHRHRIEATIIEKEINICRYFRIYHNY